MTRIYVCPECGQYNGHFAGCPEDVAPDEECDEMECEPAEPECEVTYE